MINMAILNNMDMIFSGQRVIGDYVVTNPNVEDKYIAICCEYPA